MSHFLIPNDEISSCEYCGEVVKLDYSGSSKLICPVCGSLIQRNSEMAHYYVFAFSISALMLFAPAVLYPFLTISFSSINNSANIPQSVSMLYDSGLSSVGLVVFASTVAIPAAFLLSCAYVSFSLILGRRLPFTRVALKSALKLKRWCMTDVFIIGILVSVVKMVDLADVKFDTGIYLLMISALFTVLTEQHFNVSLFWHRLASHE